MHQFITVCKRALRVLASVGAGLVALVVAAGGVLAGPTVWSQWEGRSRVESIQVGSVQRHYRVYRPAVREPRPALVVNLQGTGGNGAFQELITGFDREADRLGWVVAYPDAARGGWSTYATPTRAADVGFIAGLIDRLERTDRVDAGRVYVTGMSRGGMMAYRVGCELSSRVAAVAPVAGNMADPSGRANAVPCRPGRPVAVLDVHGSADPEVPIEGGRSRMNVESVSYAPLRAVIGTWRRIDGCAAPPEATTSTSASFTSWSCAGGNLVASVVVNGAGHTWPGATIVNPPGTAAAGFDASRLVADFFAARGRALATGCCS